MNANKMDDPDKFTNFYCCPECGERWQDDSPYTNNDRCPNPSCGIEVTPYESKDIIECTCGNPEFGFDCVCDWVKKNPGNTNFHCEFCGIYTAGIPRCNRCEKDEDQN